MIAIALLIDENLSEALLARLHLAYPGSQHVRQALGSGVSDQRIWAHARDHGLVLVTRDGDFERMSTLYGHPPKVVWLDVHNAGTTEVAGLLLGARDSIAALVADETTALLVIAG